MKKSSGDGDFKIYVSFWCSTCQKIIKLWTNLPYMKVKIFPSEIAFQTGKYWFHQGVLGHFPVGQFWFRYEKIRAGFRTWTQLLSSKININRFVGSLSCPLDKECKWFVEKTWTDYISRNFSGLFNLVLSFKTLIFYEDNNFLFI